MFEFARALAGEGHAVDVLTEFPNHPTGIIPDAYRGRWYDLDMSHPFRVARVWVFARPTKTFWTRLGFYASFLVMAIAGSWRLPRRYDVVVATSPPLPVALAGLVISRLKRAAFVMDVRDLWPRAAKALGELADGRAYRVLSVWSCSSIGARTGSRSRHRAFVRDIAERVPEVSARITLVPNGTLEAVFNPDRGDAGLRRQLGLDGACVVRYVGLPRPGAGSRDGPRCRGAPARRRRAHPVSVRR